MGSKRLTPTRVGKMASKCLLFVDGSLEAKMNRQSIFDFVEHQFNS